jgi:CubicO group peptidase (beta-lactamase class C family)
MEHRARRAGIEARGAVETGLRPARMLEGEATRWSLEERMRHYGLPGSSIAVVHAGRIEFAGGYGVLERGSDRRVDADTLFQAASMSKPVAAFLVMQQVEAGVLDLDRDVNDWLRSWRVPANAFTAARPVTLRRILSHTAGLTVHGFEGFLPDAALPSLAQILSGAPAAGTPPVVVDRLPGTEQRYSGGGTTIAQLLLEEVTGRPFAELAEERLFAPLGMARSLFRQPLPAALAGNAASGHRADGSVLEGRWRVLPQLAAGGLWCTASDYARFLLELARAARGESPLLGAAFAQQMLEQQPGGFFALGPLVREAGETLRAEHGGANQGYRCESILFTARGDGAVVMTNGDSGMPFCWEVFNAVAALHDWPGYLPAAAAAFPLPSETLARYAGLYRAVTGIDEGHRFTVTLDGPGIVGHMDGQPPSRLVPLSEVEFFSQSSPFIMRFDVGADGEPTGFSVLDGDTAIITARRTGEAPGAG